MAKSGKIVQLHQKPENYIKSRARELQIGKCYINSNWEDVGIANVIVSRKHTNGNFTLGVYLIDFKCLGIKDAYFKFNLSENEFDELVDLISGEEIDYIKAHNMIYGAEAFANDCGFKPHKDWTIAQFVLEEDNENIPIIEIEFGEDGVPAYFVGPNDSPAKIKQILATLDKTMGKENYLYYDVKDNDDFENGPLFPGNDLNEIISGKKKPTLEQMYVIATTAIGDNLEDKAELDVTFLEEISVEYVSAQLIAVDEDLDDEIEKCVSLYEAIFDARSIESVNKIKELLIQTPHNPYLYAELFLQYKALKLENEASVTAHTGMDLFPGFLYLRFLVAHAYMVDEEIEKGFELLNNCFYPTQAFPDRKYFSEGEFMFFYASLCEYFLLKDDLKSAIKCGNLLLNEIDYYKCNVHAILGVCMAIEKLTVAKRDKV